MAGLGKINLQAGPGKREKCRLEKNWIEREKGTLFGDTRRNARYFPVVTQRLKRPETKRYRKGNATMCSRTNTPWS